MDRLYHSIQTNRPLALDTTSTAKSATAATVITEGRASTIGKLVLFAVTPFRSLVGLLVSGRNNLGRKRQIGAQVLDTLIGQVAIVVLPRECDANVSLGLERLHQHQDFQVGGPFNGWVLVRFGVLLDDAHTLLKEVAVDSDTVFLWNPHD